MKSNRMWVFPGLCVRTQGCWKMSDLTTAFYYHPLLLPPALVRFQLYQTGLISMGYLLCYAALLPSTVQTIMKLMSSFLKPKRLLLLRIMVGKSQFSTTFHQYTVYSMYLVFNQCHIKVFGTGTGKRFICKNLSIFGVFDIKSSLLY